MRIFYRPIPSCSVFGFREAISLILSALLSLSLWGQSNPLSSIDPNSIQGEEAPANAGPSLGEVIGAIAEKEVHVPVDFEQLAQMTLQLGQAALQQGQRIPDESIWDGIHSVEAGNELDPLQADWETLRQELEKLLEKPPEDQQQDQDSDEQEQNNEDQSEDSENQNDSGEQNSEEDQNGEDSESNQDQNSEQQNGENQDSQQNEEDGEQSENSNEEGNNQNPQPSEKLGDMDDSENTPELDEKRGEPKEEQTQVGGTQKQPPPRSAKQAMTLQQLEQLKQQDKPGALHMLLQNAERDENAPPPQKLKKDW